MGFASIHSRTLAGIEALAVEVEVSLANGLPQFNLVGLPQTEVRESRERVRAALVHAGFQFPSRRITVNLAPADLPKQSSRFDLPIALGILAASRQIPSTALADYEFAGELALNGDLRAVQAALPMAMAACRDEHILVLPTVSAAQAAIIPQARIVPAADLKSVCRHLAGELQLPLQPSAGRSEPSYPDMADVRGQQRAKRALEIAAAGSHHVLLVGPPGTGKSMLAERYPGILPPLDERDVQLNAALHSVCYERQPHFDSWQRIPLRRPHHGVTPVALTGGGNRCLPGEVSLAHGGVLHLDEIGEFSREALDQLREPIESGAVILSRANRKTRYPAQFQLLGTMNPCPCGYNGDASKKCRCTPEQIRRYFGRLSGPLLDRIDIQLEVPRLSPRELQSAEPGESSSAIRRRVMAAVNRQQERQGKRNGFLGAEEIALHQMLDPAGQSLLENAAERLRLSARAVHRVIRVARTIADLASSDRVSTEHLAESLSYRGSWKYLA